MRLQVLAALGEPRQGLEGLYYSNLEAKETARYLDAGAGQTLLRYRDIGQPGGRWSGGGGQRLESRYQYTQETEQKLFNLVRAGDGEAARGLMRQVFTENSFPQNPKTARLLAYNLLGTLVKGMEQGGAAPAEDEAPDYLRDYNLERIPLGDLSGVLERFAAELCRRNLWELQNKSGRDLCEKVRRFIGENFRNPDTNISQTGYHFGISPFYLSGIFKKETGKNLLAYINSLRIEEGKRLLAEGREIAEAAALSGFRDAGAFIRVFKKVCGVTPGQYRKMGVGSGK